MIAEQTMIVKRKVTCYVNICNLYIIFSYSIDIERCHSVLLGWTNCPQFFFDICYDAAGEVSLSSVGNSCLMVDIV